MRTRRIGAPGAGRRADGPIGGRARCLVLQRDCLHHGGRLLVPAGAHQLAALLDHMPRRAAVLQANGGHGKAARPLPRLHEHHAVDRRVDDFAVRVAVDDEVDAGHLARHIARHVLIADTGGVEGRRATDTRVQDRHHEFSPRRADRVHRYAHIRRDVAHRHAAAEIAAVPDIDAGVRRADDPDLHAAAFDDHEGRKGARAVEAARVGRQEREARLRNGLFEERHAVVELVVADGRRVVLHRVHRRHHRMWHRRRARRHIGHRVALQQVAAIEQNDPPGVRVAQRIHRRGQPSEPAGGFCRIGEVVPGAQAPVHVRCRRNDKVHRDALGADGGRGEDDNGAREERRAGQWQHGTKL